MGLDYGRRAIECGTLELTKTLRIPIRVSAGEGESDAVLVGDRIQAVREEMDSGASRVTE
jgi:hypothetical protein